MKLSLADLFRTAGTIGRGRYALIGLVGFAIKHNLDRFVASFVFGRKWGFFNYWIPLEDAIRPASLPREDAIFLGSMVLLSLPFIWVGVALTLRRLRSAGLPAWLVLLFFAPFVNLLFFLILCVLPSHEPREFERPRSGLPLRGVLNRLIPDSAWGSAAMSLLLVSTLGTAVAAFGTQTLRSYGWGLFVALPFALGLASALLYGYHRPRTLGMCFLVAFMSVCLLGLMLMAVAIEGVACIVMAAPIGGALGLFGGWIGYLIQRHPSVAAEAPGMPLLLLLAVPALMGVEAGEPAPAPLFAVVTVTEVDAPPEAVWRRVVSFTELPPTEDWIFRIGIAYPMRAEIYGQGAGAERHCVFSTGSFVEPIEVWDAPRLLKFSVRSNPPPMQEWTPYSKIYPPHIKGFLLSRGGQFRLVPLPEGRTRIEATTWYQHNMWPAAYWQLWSDAIIHRIHARVLKHVKALSESDVLPAR